MLRVDIGDGDDFDDEDDDVSTSTLSSFVMFVFVLASLTLELYNRVVLAVVLVVVDPHRLDLKSFFQNSATDDDLTIFCFTF